MDNLLISVIVPVYNVEEYLQQCLLSVLSYKKSAVIELIIINDGSEDQSGVIANKIAGTHKNITYIETKRKGVSHARNLGIEKARGEWLLFLDADDYLPDHALEYLLEKTIIDADIIVGNYYYLKGKTRILENFFGIEEGFINQEKEKYYNDIVIGDKRIHANIGVPWAKLYRRSFITENRIVYPDGLDRMQDMIFNLCAFYYANKVYYINKPIYCYRVRMDSSVHRYNPAFSHTIDTILKEIQIFINNNNVCDYTMGETVNTKRILLFIEWCRLVPCHKDCNLSLGEKIKLIKRERKRVIGGIKSYQRNALTYSKRIIVFLFLLRLDFCAYTILQWYELLLDLSMNH